VVTSKTRLDDDRLIAEHIEFNSRLKAGRGDARLRGSKVPVWAIVGYLRAVPDIDQVAKDYDIPVDEVRAAQAFYRRYTFDVDARLLRTG
jgi:uncharacterized protein (DUF433 family)